MSALVPALRLHRLRKSYPPSSGDPARPVVAVEDLAIAAGEQLALRGESGCGKTTLLHLIAGVLVPDAGQVAIDGEPMAPAGEAARDRLRARKLGYVFQTFNLLQGFTVLENLILPMRFAGVLDPARAQKLLDRLGVGALANRLPRTLSTGQQQRVAVARALVNRPRLVLADEPTANLDARHAAAALELLRTVCAEEKAALLLVSHDERALAQFLTVRDFTELNRPG